MADGTYKLIKENSGGTFDEKGVLAESGKTLGFDASLNPVMIAAGGGTVGNIDGGTASSIYTDEQVYDGGDSDDT